MFCSQCGVPLDDSARFCSGCGKPVGGAAPVSAAPASPAESQQDTSRSQTPFQTVGDRATVGAHATPVPGRILERGARIGNRYEVRRLLGQGGMGAVYEAYDSVVKEPVALKVLLQELAQDESARERFIREARISRQLSHKNIIRVHDMSLIDDCLCISMEFVDGMDLRRFLADRENRKSPLSVKELQLLARSICDAMVYAHELTVHRDLKPENILISRQGKVKVSDFGIATLMNVSESQMTRGALGTAYYMAPEQITARGRVDPRADIYSLGVILYEALCGKIPIGRFHAPRELRSEIPENVSLAIMQALEPEPDQRFKTMAAFRDALHQAAPKPAPVAPPPARPAQNPMKSPAAPLKPAASPAAARRAPAASPQADTYAVRTAPSAAASAAPVAGKKVDAERMRKLAFTCGNYGILILFSQSGTVTVNYQAGGPNISDNYRRAAAELGIPENKIQAIINPINRPTSGNDNRVDVYLVEALHSLHGEQIAQYAALGSSVFVLALLVGQEVNNKGKLPPGTTPPGPVFDSTIAIAEKVRLPERHMNKLINAREQYRKAKGPMRLFGAGNPVPQLTAALNEVQSLSAMLTEVNFSGV
jgi:serine/threonine protein kinase